MTTRQVYNRMTNEGHRKQCTEPDDMIAAELIARIGLLAQMNLDRMPIDKVEPHAFDSHALVNSPLYYNLVHPVDLAMV